MLTGVFQLLLARQNQIDAQRQSIEALRDYWLARTALEKAVGGRLVLERHTTGHESSIQPPDGGR
jgi:cobalt-zinc-cadmium efflux system outer membrane protein